MKKVCYIMLRNLRAEQSPLKNKKGNPHMVHSMFLSPIDQANLKKLPGGRTGYIEFAGEKTKGI